MLSLRDDVPIRFGGSSGGLYGPDLFQAIKKQVPFRLEDPREAEMRVLPPNIRWMKRKHYAYIGTEDGGVARGVRLARRKMTGLSTPMLEIIEHPGRHSSALKPAMQMFLKRIKDDS